jgi:protein TonB
MKVGPLAAAALVVPLPLASTAANELRGPALETYSQLVYSHLQPYKGAYPLANGPSGNAVVKFVLGREGNVVSSTILQSSRNATLDRAALAIVQSAKPFPPFPAGSSGSTASFRAPFYFQPHAAGPVCQPGTTVKMPDGKMHPCQ